MLVSPGQHLGGTGDGDLCVVVVGGRVVNRGQARFGGPGWSGWSGLETHRDAVEYGIA